MGNELSMNVIFVEKCVAIPCLADVQVLVVFIAR